MTRKLTRKFRRLAVAIAFAALMIPATAIAHPMGNTAPDSTSPAQPQVLVAGKFQPQDFINTGSSRANATGAATPTYVLIEGKWQPQGSGQVAESSFVPSDPGQARVTTDTQSRPSAPTVKIVQVPADSGFGWTDALIGAGVTAAIVLLALAGAMSLRRQGKLSYR